MRRTKGFQEFFGRLHRGLLVRLARHHDGEFVAAHAAGQIVFRQQTLQSTADFLQQPVAHGVAERVVDLLETIEIDK